MTIEYAQILSTAADLGGFFEPTRMYEPIPDLNPKVHEWASESRDNYVALLKLAKETADEYERRYGRTHKSMKDVIGNIDISDIQIHEKGFTDPPQCMPDVYRVEDDYVRAYRKFYIHGKDWAMTWTNREEPDWYTGKLVDDL